MQKIMIIVYGILTATILTALSQSDLYIISYILSSIITSLYIKNKRDMDNLITRNNQLDRELDKKYKLLDKYNSKATQLQSENSNLKSENSNLKSENSNLKSENSNLKSENSNLKSENSNLKSDLDSIKQIVIEKDDTVKKLQSKVDKLNIRLNEQRYKFEQLTSLITKESND